MTSTSLSCASPLSRRPPSPLRRPANLICVALLVMVSSQSISSAWAQQSDDASVGSPQQTNDPPTTSNAQPSAGALTVPMPDNVLKPGSRYLCLGDGLTQQMFYTRALAAGLIAVVPEGHVRLFNGGKTRSTVAQANQWAPDAVEFFQPSVVTVCFGFEQAREPGDPDAISQAYARELDKLVEQLQDMPSVKAVIVISPPPVQAGLSRQGPDDLVNRKLKAMARQAGLIALKRKAGYVNWFTHLRSVYLAQLEAGGEPLTIGGQFPSEQANVIMASMVLKALGVDADDIERIAWSPLRPVEMRRIRPALAWPVDPPSLERAQISRDVYEMLRRHDELVFKAWRLAPRQPSMGPPSQFLGQADRLWYQLRQMVWAQP